MCRGCFVFLARWLSYFHRPLPLVDVAWCLSDVEVWDHHLCPGYIFLDFLVILRRRLVLPYGVGGLTFENAVRLLSFQRSCLVGLCPLKLIGPGAYHKISLGTPVTLDWLVLAGFRS